MKLAMNHEKMIGACPVPSKVDLRTYLTLSLTEIAHQAQLADVKEAEEILFDMISEGWEP